MNEAVDIQAEKRNYLKFRRKMVLGMFLSAVFIIMWAEFTNAPKTPIAAFWNFFTPWGWPLPVSWVLMLWYLHRWCNHHFHCPSCDGVIYLSHDWVCHRDRSVTMFPLTLWYTIFTGCRKHNHLSPAHKCPNCGHVFLLLENPRTGTNKFSYRPGIQALSPPPEQSSTGEAVPRDRFF
jgi:hypothetical protein